MGKTPRLFAAAGGGLVVLCVPFPAAARRGEVVRVRPSARASSSIARGRVSAAPAPAPVIVRAALGPVAAPDRATPDGGSAAGGGSAIDPGKIAWRLPPTRRSILKDV